MGLFGLFSESVSYVRGLAGQGLRLYGSSSGSVRLKPASAAGSVEYTAPSADGSAGQALSTNGSGTLSWASFAALDTGKIVAFGMTLPAGYLACDGSAVSRSTYATLFSTIGTTWGTGDGSTTFNLPDLRGRAPIGSGTGSGLTARTLAQTVGAETVQLVTSELPAHSHSPRISGANVYTNGTAGSGQNTVAATSTTTGATQWQTASQGSDGSHANMQPSTVVHFGIKT